MSRCGRVPSLGISGSGLHFLYQIGAVDQLLSQNVYTERVCCTSAGMAAALYYLLDLRDCLPIDRLLALLPSPHACNQVVHEWRVMFQGWMSGHYQKNPLHLARERMIEELCRTLEENRPDAWRQVSGRLRVTLVELPSWRVREFSHFHSNEDLLRCLRATTCIPYISTPRATCWRGRRWIDGGAKDDHPIFDGCTVVVTTTRYYQPWAPVWDAKKCWWGEISRALDPESAHVVRCRAYYHRIYRLGKFDAQRYLDGHPACCV